MLATVVDTVDVVESAMEIIFWWRVNRSTVLQSWKGSAERGTDGRATGEAGCLPQEETASAKPQSRKESEEGRTKGRG